MIRAAAIALALTAGCVTVPDTPPEFVVSDALACLSYCEREHTACRASSEESEWKCGTYRRWCIGRCVEPACKKVEADR